MKRWDYQERRHYASSDSLVSLMLTIQAESDDRKTASQKFRDQMLHGPVMNQRRERENMLGIMLFPVLSEHFSLFALQKILRSGKSKLNRG